MVGVLDTVRYFPFAKSHRASRLGQRLGHRPGTAELNSVFDRTGNDQQTCSFCGDPDYRSVHFLLVPRHQANELDNCVQGSKAALQLGSFRQLIE